MKNNSIILGFCLLLLGNVGCDYYPRKDIKYEATLNVQSLNMFVDEVFQLKANPTELSFTWTSDNESVATVSSTGLVTAVGRGTANITSRAGDVNCTVLLTSIVRIPMLDYILGVTSIEVLIGGMQEIKIVPEPTDANDVGTVNWRSVNPNVATVNYSGIVRAVGLGTTQVESEINGIIKSVNVLVARTLPFNGPHYLSLTQSCVIKAVDFDYGDYIFDAYISVNNSGSSYGIEVDGDEDNKINFNLISNGDWQNYRWYHQTNTGEPAPPPIHLTVGRHTVKFLHNSGGF